MSLASFNQDDYKLDGLTKKFLSESPTTKDIELGQNEFLGMAWTVSSGGVKNYLIKILTYDSIGALLNTDNLAVTDWNATTVSSYIDPYLDVPVGTANLIAMGVSLTNVSSYTVQLVSDDGDRSEIRTFNIVNSCSTDARVSTTYSSSDFGEAVIQNNTEKTFTSYSKSIGRDILNFANSMLITKVAWLEIDGNYFSILIDDGSKLVRNEQNMPIQFVLNFSLANIEKGHRG